MLSDEDKARIEAEERYRAEVRARLASGTPLVQAGATTPSKARAAYSASVPAEPEKVPVRPFGLPPFGWVLGGLAILALLFNIPGKQDRPTTSSPASASSSAPRKTRPSHVEQPVSAEITILQSDDEMGLDAYFILTGLLGDQIKSAGTVVLNITAPVEIGSDREDWTVFERKYSITTGCFYETTRGLGSFARKATLCTLPHIDGSEIVPKPASSFGKATFKFFPVGGEMVMAKTSVFLPD